MRIICVDDVQTTMEDIVAFCRKLPRITEVVGFTCSSDAMEWLKTNHADLESRTSICRTWTGLRSRRKSGR